MKKLLSLLLILTLTTSCINIQPSGLKTKKLPPFPDKKIEQKGISEKVNLTFKQYACFKKEGEKKLFLAGWFVNIDKQIQYQQTQNRLEQARKYIEFNSTKKIVDKYPSASNTYTKIIQGVVVTFIITSLATGTITYYLTK